jgi:hypothetical protein
LVAYGGELIYLVEFVEAFAGARIAHRRGQQSDRIVVVKRLDVYVKQCTELSCGKVLLHACKDRSVDSELSISGLQLGERSKSARMARQDEKKRKSSFIENACFL